MRKVMSKYKDVLDTLEAQMKQIEIQYYKMQGAIEVVKGLQDEAKKEAAEARKKAKLK